MTFALEGFSGIRREGIELTTGFTATINADMRVGSIAETITVVGAESRRRYPERPAAGGDDARRHRRDSRPGRRMGTSARSSRA